jgi:hypothetical protein
VHHWEHFDSRLLVCEAYLLPNSVIDQSKKSSEASNKSKNSFPLSAKANFLHYANVNGISNNTSGASDAKKAEEAADAEQTASSECLVVSMFFNPDKGLLVYDSYGRGEIYSKLISVRIPYHFFVTKVFYLIKKNRIKYEKSKIRK